MNKTIGLISQQFKFEKKKAIISLGFGVISLIPTIIYIATETWFIYLERFWFIFFPLAIFIGFGGIKTGIKSLKSEKIAILGIILSILGMGSALLILIFGLYTARF